MKTQVRAKRRLVSGILQIVTGAILGFYGLYVIGATPFVAQAGAGFWGFIFALYVIGIGVFYTCTSKRQPKKAVEYTLLIIWLVLFIIVETVCRQLFSDALIFTFIDAIVYSVGLPTRHGYKNIPWQKKTATTVSKPSATDTTVKQETQAKSNIDVADELAKYKKLLDDKAITQDEYDKKKKELLNE